MNHGRHCSSHHLLNYKSQLISVPEEVLRAPRRLKVLWEPASLLRLASTTLLADPSCSHYFTTGSQSCLFSTSPLLLSPLDWKEIKPVNPKGNQPWTFIRRTDAEAPICWHLTWRADSLEKIWCWERLRAREEGSDRGWDGWMASVTQCTWVWANSRR